MRSKYPTTLTLALILSGCLSQGNDQSATSSLMAWSVDTIAAIGVAEGDTTQEFGMLIAAEISSGGDVILLDLRRPGVFWFDSTGQFKAVTAAGRGPGEVNQPRAIAANSAGAVLVLDPGNGRLSYLRESGGRVVPDSSINMPYITTSLCESEGRVYASFTRDGMVAHILGSDANNLQSFGPEPVVPLPETLGTFAVAARRQIVEPILFCDSQLNQVVLAGRSHHLVRAYDSLGEIAWSTQLDNIHSVAFAMDDAGTVEGVIDPVNGVSFVRSIVAWDPQHLLIQYERRFPGEPPEGQEFHEVDSRLLDLATGAEVGRSNRLPVIAAMRGDLFVVIENYPYPKAIFGRRH